MKNNKWIISLAAVLMMVSSFAFGQEKLDPIVAYSLKKIPIALGKAEDLTNKGDLPNAKVYLKSAQKEWDRINKNFKERFDPTHPDIVAVRKQLKDVKAKVDAAAGPPKKDQKRLDPIVVYSLKKIPIALGKAEDLTNKGDLPNAKVYLKSAQKEWDRINKNFKERFDPTHPDIVAAREQLKNVKEKVEEADQKKKP